VGRLSEDEARIDAGRLSLADALVDAYRLTEDEARIDAAKYVADVAEAYAENDRIDSVKAESDCKAKEVKDAKDKADKDAKDKKKFNADYDEAKAEDARRDAAKKKGVPVPSVWSKMYNTCKWYVAAGVAGAVLTAYAMSGSGKVEQKPVEQKPEQRIIYDVKVGNSTIKRYAAPETKKEDNKTEGAKPAANVTPAVDVKPAANVSIDTLIIGAVEKGNFQTEFKLKNDGIEYSAKGREPDEKMVGRAGEQYTEVRKAEEARKTEEAKAATAKALADQAREQRLAAEAQYKTKETELKIQYNGFKVENRAKETQGSVHSGYQPMQKPAPAQKLEQKVGARQSFNLQNFSEQIRVAPEGTDASDIFSDRAKASTYRMDSATSGRVRDKLGMNNVRHTVGKWQNRQDCYSAELDEMCALSTDVPNASGYRIISAQGLDKWIESHPGFKKY
jgi:hypothetical protein